MLAQCRQILKNEYQPETLFDLQVFKLMFTLAVCLRLHHLLYLD